MSTTSTPAGAAAQEAAPKEASADGGILGKIGGIVEKGRLQAEAEEQDCLPPNWGTG